MGLLYICTVIFHCCSGGFLLLTGAKAGLEGTPGEWDLIPVSSHFIVVNVKFVQQACRNYFGCSQAYVHAGMIGYGMAKAAVHQLVASLSQPKSGMPENSSVVAILP